MGICSFLCKAKDNQIIDNLNERISTRRLNGKLDPDRSFLKIYIDSNKNQMLPAIRGIYSEAISYKLLKVSIINDKINQRQAKFLHVALRYSLTLEILNLRNNDLGDFGAKLLSDAFQYTTHLIQVTIEDNHIKNEGCKAIFSNLHNLTGLEILSLSHNLLGDSVYELRKVLPFLDNLTELYLEVMEITSSDFISLSFQLCDCKKLVKLGLGNNKLDYSCLAALNLVLNSLPVLQECILSGIEISDYEIDKFIISFINLDIKV